MSCIFAGQHFSSFPSLQMSFEAPFAGFLAAKDIPIAPDLFGDGDQEASLELVLR